MRWALIGASTIADGPMVGAIRAQGGTVGWIVSGSQARAQDFAARHGGQATTEMDRALADPTVGAVYISSTNEKHFPQAMAAIAAGKAVLCEKPLAMTVDQAAIMVRAAADKGVTFATNHHLRCAGSHRAIKALIDAGRIGRILSVRVHHAVFLPPVLQGWRISAPEAGGGVIADITVHDADTVRFHLGEDPVAVVAQATVSGLGQGVEDSCRSAWSMPSGAQVFAHESFTHAHAGTGIEFHGTEGSILARNVMTQRPVGEIELVTSRGREAIGFAAADLYTTGLGAFLEAVAGRGRPAADGVDGLKSLAVAAAVRQAATTGLRTQVAYAGF